MSKTKIDVAALHDSLMEVEQALLGGEVISFQQISAVEHAVLVLSEIAEKVPVVEIEYVYAWEKL